MIQTPFTKRLGITHPILLAGMANISKADLAAAVSNAGGLGVVGGAFGTDLWGMVVFWGVLGRY